MIIIERQRFKRLPRNSTHTDCRTREGLRLLNCKWRRVYSSDRTFAILASTSNTNVIAIDGLYLDIIETSLPASQEAIQLSLDEFINHPSGIARVVEFKEIFTTKMMQGSYPTGEDQHLAFARCLLLDNKSYI